MKIIIIDDEKYIRRMVSDFLKNEGYEVVEGKDGFDGIKKIRENLDIDLILLDVRMPMKNGFETYKEIKGITDAPVLFLTAQKETKHELEGLNLGAYDYITKPFNYDVLSVRIRNCIKQVSNKTDGCIEIGRLRIEPSIRKVFIDNKEVMLTNKEYTLLDVLMDNKKNIISRDQLLDKVWGFDYDGNQRTVDVHIQTLRSKLEPYGKLIKTVRGAGYYFEMDEKEID